MALLLLVLLTLWSSEPPPPPNGVVDEGLDWIQDQVVSFVTEDLERYSNAQMYQSDASHEEAEEIAAAVSV